MQFVPKPVGVKMRLGLGIGVVAIGLVGLIGYFNVMPLRPDPNTVFDNPEVLKLKGVDGEMTAELEWRDLEFQLSGLRVMASVTGVFLDSANVLNSLVSPEEPKNLIDSRALKVFQMPGATSHCIGTTTRLDCTTNAQMRIDTPFGKLDNRLNIVTRSLSELDGNEITFRHRILDDSKLPAIAIDILNSELSSKDRTRGLPPLFADHNITIENYEFAGSSETDDLRMHLSLSAGVTDFIRALF